jgi:transposase
MRTTIAAAGGAWSVPPTYEELLLENVRLRRRVVELERRIAELERQLESVREQGKRQAAPFRKRDEPIKRPQKPGRKKGKRHGKHAHRQRPPRIDEKYDAPLPDKCPHCGSRRLHETHVAPLYQTEIPRRVIFRQFDVHFGICDRCRRPVAGRHALQTSSACGAAASQLGPNVHSALAILNKQLGLSHGKSVRLLATLFDELNLARATSVRSIQRTAGRGGPAYQRLRQDVRESQEVAPDETGWRVAGRSAWLHTFVSPRATCYVIDATRSGRPALELLGADWSGTLVHDGWSVYDGFTAAAHQQCLRHLQRRCQEMVETAAHGAERFPHAVLALLDQAYAVRRMWRGHRLNTDQSAEQGLLLSCALEELASGRFSNAANRRLAKHLLSHAMQWFWFLIDPRIQATNHWAEQAMRPAVVNRKVWGGNRTWPGAKAQSVLTSIIRTCGQRAVEPFRFLRTLLCQPHPQLIPP